MRHKRKLSLAYSRVENLPDFPRRNKSVKLNYDILNPIIYMFEFRYYLFLFVKISGTQVL